MASRHLLLHHLPMPIILPPGDPTIARLAATALRAAATLPERLARLRQVALAEAGRLEGRAARHVLVAAGHAARLVLRQHGMSDLEARLQAGRMTLLWQIEVA